MSLDPEYLLDAIVISSLARSLEIPVELEQTKAGIQFNTDSEILDLHLAVLCAGAGMRNPEDVCDTTRTRAAFAAGKKISISIRSRLRPESISGTASMIPGSINLQDAVDRLLENADFSRLRTTLTEQLAAID
jgi:hypothetical protein